MHRFFWKAASVLFEKKRALVTCLLLALLTGVSFASSLGMVLAGFQLMLEQHRSLAHIAAAAAQQSQLPGFLKGALLAATGFLPTDPFWSFCAAMVLLVLLGGASALSRYHYQLHANRLILDLLRVWRSRLFSKLLGLPMEVVRAWGLGDSTSRVVHDVHILYRGLNSMIGKSAADAVKGLAAVGVALLLNWKITVVALLGGPPIVILLNRLSKQTRRVTRSSMESHSRLVGTLQEALINLPVVKLHNAGRLAQDEFAGANDRYFREQLKIRKSKVLTSLVVEVFTLIMISTVACLAAWSVLLQGVPPASLMTVALCLVTGGSSLASVTRFHQHVNEAGAAAARLFEVIDLPDEGGGPDAGRALPRHGRSLIFEDVVFGYRGRQSPVLDHINLHIEHGQFVVLVGANGSGKTTLLSLIPRLIEPVAGRVLVDGSDVSRVSLSSLRDQIAMILEETHLFQGTIAGNLSHGRPGVSRDRIVEAARLASAHEFIQTLAHGYDTCLGDLGRGLSAGQRQRLAVARAIVRDPAILLLDEVNSRVDAESRSQIDRALRQLRRNRTVLAATHREEVASAADLVVVLDGGRIVESGTHDELLHRSRLYPTLIQPLARAVGVTD